MFLSKCHTFSSETIQRVQVERQSTKGRSLLTDSFLTLGFELVTEVTDIFALGKVIYINI